MQSLLLLIHWFIFHSLAAFAGNRLGPAATLALRDALVVLAFSFIVATLLSFRYSNWLVVAIYRIAAVWLGFLDFFFLAACLCWFAALAVWISPFASTLPEWR